MLLLATWRWPLYLNLLLFDMILVHKSAYFSLVSVFHQQQQQQLKSSRLLMTSVFYVFHSNKENAAMAANIGSTSEKAAVEETNSSQKVVSGWI